MQNNIMTQLCLHCIRAYNGEMPYTDLMSNPHPWHLNNACNIIDYELKLLYKVNSHHESIQGHGSLQAHDIKGLNPSIQPRFSQETITT